MLRWQSKINANDSAAETAAHARACWEVAARLGVRGPGHEPVVFAQSTGPLRRGGGRHQPVPLPGVTRRAADGRAGPAFKQRAACLVIDGVRAWQVEGAALGPLVCHEEAGRSVCAGGCNFRCFQALLESPAQS